MEKLSYKVLEEIGYPGFVLREGPEKVMQFGEGNFLRAFVDYWLDLVNERTGWGGKCLLVQPRASAHGQAERINSQEGLYTLYLKGNENGWEKVEKRVISCISRCVNPHDPEGYEAMMELAESDELAFIVSNTTEAGIVFDPYCRLTDRPASSYPGKLTQVLLRRFGKGRPGTIIIACELIDDNGRALQKCVDQYIDQWELSPDFRKYVHEDCVFCGSLVDRIVPGRIRDPGAIHEIEEKNGYRDDLVDVGEIFGLWVIEGDGSLAKRLPFEKAGLSENVFVAKDISPYKKRKVRILNGAHTGFVPGAFLAGHDIVRDSMQDDLIYGFLNKMLFDEIIPTISLSKEELIHFTRAVEDRFNNPFIDHELQSITLNSTSKWRARDLPPMLDYIKLKNELPICLSMSLAGLIAYMSNDIRYLDNKGLHCVRPSGDEYIVADDPWVTEFYFEHRNDSPWCLTEAVLQNDRMWGQDLTKIEGLPELVAKDLELIRKEGAREAFASCI